MNTLAAHLRSATPLHPAAGDLLVQAPVTGGAGALRALTLVIVIVLVLLALRSVGRALEPIIELARTFAAASLAAVLLLAALVLVVVVTIGYV